MNTDHDRRDRRIGGLFALLAYTVPIVAYAIAHAAAGPATGGPSPPDAGTYLAYGGLIAAPVFGGLAFAYGCGLHSGTLKVLGGIALVLGGLLLLLAMFGPSPG